MFPNTGVRYISKVTVNSRKLILNNSKMFKEIKQIIQPEIKIRNRPHLAGSQSNNFPNTIPKNSSPFLKAVEFQNSHNADSRIFSSIGNEVRKDLDDYFNDDYSAVYIRNLPIKTAKDFDELVKHLRYQPMTYFSGSGFREPVQDMVYSASNEPPEFSIEPHNEMSYTVDPPTKIIFCCIKNAEDGGESPVVFNRDLAKCLDNSWLEKLRSRGIRYLRNIKHERNTDYISWQSTFMSHCEEDVEDLMRKQSMSWKWSNNGDLTIWYQGDVFINHPVTGEEIFCNQVTANHWSYYHSHPMYNGVENLEPNEYSFNCAYGNGEEFEEELIDHIRSVAWKVAVPLALNVGDVLVLDNLLVQHSRMSYEGDRKIIVYLGDPIKAVKRNNVDIQKGGKNQENLTSTSIFKGFTTERPRKYSF